ncbi:UNVERIFIED_CONTAM: hypothetical protein RMT77_015760 [Armadillidium vulgare]
MSSRIEARYIMYCEKNLTINDIWVDKGFNPCFFDTITVGIYANFLILLGLIQWYQYSKGTPVPTHLRPASLLYWFQIGFSIFIPLVAVVRFCLQCFIIGSHYAYGYMIAYMGWSVVCWPLSVLLILQERTKRIQGGGDFKIGHSYVLVFFWSMAFLTENLAIVNFSSPNWWFRISSVSDVIELTLYILRYVSMAFLFIIGLLAPGIPQEYRSISSSERNGSNGSDNASTWKNFFKKIKILLPFMWPRKNIVLQFVVFLCVIFLILGRIVNVVVPIYYKEIVNSLGGDGKPAQFCWDLILVYVFIKFLQGGGFGGMGMLNNARTFLWISVQQYTTREVQVQLFAHLHSLSLRWHLSRKTGEVVRIMDRGTTSVNQLLAYIVFNIVPTIFDIIIAVVFFSTSFNVWFGVIVFVTMVAYLVATIVVTEWRTKFRRTMNLADNELKTKSVDSLLNYETVKYYSGEEFEIDRYRDCILRYQAEEWKSNATLSLLNTAQNIIINVGLLIGSIFCAWMVYEKELTVGDYVLFSTYIVQLYTPLNWFGTYYRMIQQSFIDTENMFDLLDEKQEVVDTETAEDLLLPQGKIEFKNVSFHYTPEKEILSNISFTVLPGKTIAIVGPSGAGKSTIMRLLFRFFEVTGGQILIDDKDIRQYRQRSLRQAFGVVPQDTVLFNESVLYNIKYGKVTASDEEAMGAAQNAEIHESIIDFPDQYETMVGERGLKLSGGEKQRVAIARTILKGPSFILLDEATSALDTQTERNIQAALLKICTGRTTVIIAHRLSTIIHADCILVLQNGVIAEKGSHNDLLHLDGVYASMWQQQQENINGNGSSDSGSPESKKEEVSVGKSWS